mmetsp:Transcript_24311/g.36038  ORF Transcript_24311/g.36038 Transcript_24311/m.36038 type:complete len:248 (-) Transcript_24311:916-1659(-)
MTLFMPLVVPLSSSNSAAVRDLMLSTLDPVTPRLNFSASFLMLPLFAFNASKSEAAGESIDSAHLLVFSGENTSCFMNELRPKLANSASVRDRRTSALLLVMPRSNASAVFFMLPLLPCSDWSSAVVLDFISARLLLRGVSNSLGPSCVLSLQSNACTTSFVLEVLPFRAANSAAVRDFTSSKLLFVGCVNTSAEIFDLFPCCWRVASSSEVRDLILSKARLESLSSMSVPFFRASLIASSSDEVRV